MKLVIALLLTALVLSSQAQQLPERQAISDLLFPFGGESYNGYIQVNNQTGSAIYYHLFGYNNGTINNPQVPLIFWFQGGPGCSGEIGLYAELGPFSVIRDGPDYRVIPRDKNWNKLGHTVFIDQPVGTGFSLAFKGEVLNTTAQAAVHFQVFIARFFQVFPEFLQNEVYLTGESYAGHWIPAFANYLLTNTSNSYINLKGVALGDAWINPLYQTPVYSTMCYVVGLLNQKERDYIKLIENHAVQAMLSGDYVYATQLSNFILDNVCVLGGGCDDNNYRRYPVPSEDFHTVLTGFLSLEEVQKRLKLPVYKAFSMCNGNITDAMLGDNSESTADTLPLVLSKLKTLIYVGQDDENVNYEGILNYLKFVDYDPIQSLLAQKKKNWNLNGQPVGHFKKEGDLTFVTVYKSGHLVPTDQPESAFDMLNRFINNIPFDQ